MATEWTPKTIFTGYYKGASGPVGINRLDHAPQLAAGLSSCGHEGRGCRPDPRTASGHFRGGPRPARAIAFAPVPRVNFAFAGVTVAAIKKFLSCTLKKLNEQPADFLWLLLFN